MVVWEAVRMAAGLLRRARSALVREEGGGVNLDPAVGTVLPLSGRGR